ncbi:MAG TPA: hypothetical protein VFT43_09635, partial [Candidatus Polarisedimenticolia bacterium]|nr:hypothetical protein [Candidatus Polarisedimenticolia bacterium]
SRLTARGRVVPREGRMTLLIDARRVSAAVSALPGFEGDGYTLDLREERIEVPATRDLERAAPDLGGALDTVAARGNGLLLVAAPGGAEAGAGLRAILELLDPRLPRRVAVGEWPGIPGLELLAPPGDEEEVPPGALVERALEHRPDLLALAGVSRPGELLAALALARERVVVAVLPSRDAFAAVEWIVRAGYGPPAGEGGLTGILAVRLLESLCSACRRACDLRDLRSSGPGGRLAAGGPYFTGQGCTLCRGSGVRRLAPIYEFLPTGADDGLFRVGMSAAGLRERCARAGMVTLASAALSRAAEGSVDVRESLRLLLHEPS